MKKKPWSLIKDPAQQKNVHEICTLGINLFRQLMIYLKPVMPETAIRVEQLLNCPPLMWHDKQTPLLNHKMNVFQPLAERIEKKQIENLKMEAQQVEANIKVT